MCPVVRRRPRSLARRTPNDEALAHILRGAERVEPVTDSEVADAMRALFSDTHNVAEGAGAAGLAALLRERAALQGKRAGIILSGSNVDRDMFTRVLAAA